MREAQRSFFTGKSYQLRFTPDGSAMVAFARDLAVWSISLRKKIAFGHRLKHIAFVDVSPTGRSVLLKSTSGAMCVLSLPELTTIQSFPVKCASEGCQALFSPCGNYVIDGSWSGLITAHDLKTSELSTWDRHDRTLIISLCSTTDRALFAYVLQPIAKNRIDPPEPSRIVLRRWPFDRHEAEVIQSNWSYVLAISLSPDGGKLAVLQIHKSGEFTLGVHSLSGDLKVQSRSVLPSFTNHSLAWSPDGATVACVESGQISLFESATMSRVAKQSAPYPSHVEFSPSGELLAIGSWEQGLVVRVQDLERA